MNGLTNMPVNVGKCSRTVLVFLIFSCIAFLLIENGILKSWHSVDILKIIEARKGLRTIVTYRTALPMVTEYNQHLATAAILRNNTENATSSAYKHRNNITIISYDNSSVFNMHLNTTEQMVSSDRTINISKAKLNEGILFYPPDPFEIYHAWKEHFKKGALEIFILSAVGIKSPDNNGYHIEVKLNGWQAFKHRLVSIKCCILWKSKKISEYNHPVRTHQKKRIGYLGSQIACPIKSGSLDDVKGVTLQFSKKQCTNDKATYVRPLVTRSPEVNDSFAVCLKILYGEIDDLTLIYWIEYYREMKVDKIFTFTYNISSSNLEILKHYYNLGILEWRKFYFPGGSRIGKKIPVFWEDEQVVIYDIFSRFYGYKYFAIIDLDEYLLPRQHENLKQMMRYLVTQYPKGAGFEMKSYIFNKRWGTNDLSDGPDVLRYTKRTNVFTGVKARPKNVLLPERIEFNGEFHTHKFVPKDGYEKVVVNESIASINHYRDCYSGLKHACDRKKAVTDTKILEVIDRIRERAELFASQLQDKG